MQHVGGGAGRKLGMDKPLGILWGTHLTLFFTTLFSFACGEHHRSLDHHSANFRIWDWLGFGRDLKMQLRASQSQPERHMTKLRITRPIEILFLAWAFQHMQQWMIDRNTESLCLTSMVCDIHKQHDTTFSLQTLRLMRIDHNVSWVCFGLYRCCCAASFSL